MNRPTEEPERPAAARDDLESWRESQPSNFVKESRQFNRLMDRLSDPENRRAQASSLDHFGAVVRQHHGAEWARPNAGQLDDPYSL